MYYGIWETFLGASSGCGSILVMWKGINILSDRIGVRGGRSIITLWSLSGSKRTKQYHKGSLVVSVAVA